MLGFAIAAILQLPTARAQGPATWPPVPPEELGLKDNAFDPGSPAMILEYEVQTDNTKETETVYKRIKIFREEGKRFANIEIPYVEKFTKVEEIRARVTSLSGKGEDFNGAIYDKEVIKFKKFLYNAKTFTLPNTEVGSVIEYSYRLHWHSKIPDVFKNPGQYLITEAMAYPAAEWEIQQEIPTRHGRFTLHPIRDTHPVIYSHDLPKDAVKRTLDDGTIQLEVNYLSGFQKEEYSPPEENLKIRADMFYTVGFSYTLSFSPDPWSFWRTVAHEEAQYYNKFIGDAKKLQRVAESLFSSADSDETKLKKIYARVQQIRALSYESEKTKQQRKQESLKENKNVEDVLNRGYAFNNEINLVFIALARAAGFQAFPVRIASRNRAFFVRERFDPSQLDSLVVEVVRSGNSQFLDPATVYCPERFLPWEETDAGGIRIDSHDAHFETTPVPESKDAVIRRSAQFHLDAEGNLEGKLLVSYEGQEALRRRLNAIDQDEAERRKELEEEVQHLLTQGGSVKLLSAEGLTASGAPLKAQFEIQVPSFASRAGQRLMMPVAVFHSAGQNPFASVRRVNPVYFDYPAESYEEVKLELPPGVRIESLPATTKIERGTTVYESSAAQQGNIVELKRMLKMAVYYVPADRYSALRQFYEQVRAGDEQQAVFKLTPPDKQ